MNKKKIEVISTQIVKHIARELQQEWKGVDDDVRMEIEKSWEKFITRLLEIH